MIVMVIYCNVPYKYSYLHDTVYSTRSPSLEVRVNKQERFQSSLNTFLKDRKTFSAVNAKRRLQTSQIQEGQETKITKAI